MAECNCSKAGLETEIIHPSTCDMHLWALFWPFLFNYLPVFIWFHSRDLSLFHLFFEGGVGRGFMVFFFFFSSEGLISVRKISITSNLLSLICSLSLLISLCLCFNNSSYEHNPVPFMPHHLREISWKGCTKHQLFCEWYFSVWSGSQFNNITFHLRTSCPFKFLFTQSLCGLVTDERKQIWDCS